MFIFQFFLHSASKAKDAILEDQIANAHFRGCHGRIAGYSANIDGRSCTQGHEELEAGVGIEPAYTVLQTAA